DRSGRGNVDDAGPGLASPRRRQRHPLWIGRLAAAPRRRSARERADEDLQGPRGGRWSAGGPAQLRHPRGLRRRRALALRGEGQPWVAAPNAYSDDVLTEGDSVVWVGASYDVSPASYFVLRYIRDVREPKDLVILTRGPLSVRHGGAVHYLGMLWAVSENKILRIDPTALELMSYALTDSSGRLAKRSFQLKQEGEKLLYFDGNTVR